MTSPRSRGMTLVELLLAMAITSIVAMAAAGMLSAVSYGSSERSDLRAMIVRQEMIAVRLSAAIRAARQVLVCNDTTLILWITDANHDNKPQVSEVRWIEFDAAADEITNTHITWPGAFNDEQKTAADKDYVAGLSRDTQHTGMSAYVVHERWASDVHSWELTPSHAVLTQCTLVSFRVTFADSQEQTQTMIGAAALRSQ